MNLSSSGRATSEAIMHFRPLQGCMQSLQQQQADATYQQLRRSVATGQHLLAPVAWQQYTVSGNGRQLQQLCNGHGALPRPAPAATASEWSTKEITSSTFTSHSDDTSSSMCDDELALNSNHLQAYLLAHPELSSVQLVKDAGKQLTDADVIKSLLILVLGKPHIVVLRGADKLDLKKVAICLGVAKRQVRLAKHCETVQLCGFLPGTVPPLGHATPLPTLVDAEVARLAGLLYAGGGDHDIEMVLDVSTLLLHTHATVADVAVWSVPTTAAATAAAAALPSTAATAATPTSTATQAQASAAQAPQHTQQESNSSDGSTNGGVACSNNNTGLPLPRPWAPGSEQVELMGMVAVRRRVAKLLQFCMLIPLSDDCIQPAGQTSYIRRAWANPMQQQAAHGSVQQSSQQASHCEVQLIMGKTLERRLGRDAAIALLDSIRPGVAIRVQGIVQPHGPPPDYVPTPHSKRAARAAERDANMVRAHRTTTAAQQSSHLVLDVVCHDVQLLMQDSTEQSQSRSSRRGVRHAAAAAAAAAASDESSQHHNSNDSRTIDTPVHTDVTMQLQPDLHQVAYQHQVSNQHGIDTQPERPYWMGADIPVYWVDDLDGLTQARQHIKHCIVQQAQQRVGMGDDEDADSTTGSIMQAMRSCLPLPVGVDCEWVPFTRDQQPTPVALMQVALRDCVFLIDMLAVTAPAPAINQQPPSYSHGHSNDSDAAEAASQASHADAALTPMQQELCALLQVLFMNPDVTPLGFQLNQDLKNLTRSYPFLLPFLTPNASSRHGSNSAMGTQEQGQLLAQLLAQQPLQYLSSSRVTTSVNGVTYVDVLHLARAARPEQFLLSFGRPPAMSLGSIVKEVFGVPLDKTYQRSDWAARPLSAGQYKYAAADASSLVALHDTLLLTNV